MLVTMPFGELVWWWGGGLVVLWVWAWAIDRWHRDRRRKRDERALRARERAAAVLPFRRPRKKGYWERQGHTDAA